MTTYNGTRFPDSLTGGSTDDSISGFLGNDTLTGNTGRDVIIGGAGNDSLYSTYSYGGNDSAQDTLYGEGGDDYLVASSNDLAYGGFGLDIVVASDSNPFILSGGGGRDTLVIEADVSGSRISTFERLEISSYYAAISAAQLSSFAVIGGQVGQTEIYFELSQGGTGRANFDRAIEIAHVRGGQAPVTLSLAAGSMTALDYYGGVGDNTITSGSGNDTLTGNQGSDILRGGAGDDLLYSTYSYTSNDDDPDWLNGGVGNDSLRAGTNDFAYGGSGDDTLIADDEHAEMHGGAGDDWMQASRGADILDGGGGVDTVSFETSYVDLSVNLNVRGFQDTGGSGGDSLTGFENVIGGSGDDTLVGTAAANLLEGGRGDDVLNGGAGSDTASYAGSTSDVAVDLRISGAQDTDGAGIDTLLDMENLIGGAGDDRLAGTALGNVIEGGEGSDIIDGRLGIDVADYVHATAHVEVRLDTTGPQNTGGAGTDTLIRIEDLRGSAFADALTGNRGANHLTGLDGNDFIVGLGGSDTLTGGLGADRMRGGGGADVFDFNSTGESTRTTTDVIGDFAGVGQSWGDRIDLSTIDANTGASGNQAFALGVRSAGGLSLVDWGASTLVRGNTDADAAFEFTLLIRDGGKHASDYIAADFIL